MNLWLAEKISYWDRTTFGTAWCELYPGWVDASYLRSKIGDTHFDLLRQEHKLIESLELEF